VARIWYGNSVWKWPLVPLSWLYAVAVQLRRQLYKSGILRTVRVNVPIVVVGNINVGGTGKTPVTAWLCRQLKAQGFRPAIVSRGYGGKVGRRPVLVAKDSDPAIVGDEPLLLCRQTGCAVAVHPDRVAATNTVIKEGADIVIADDGLQHLRLGRDYEIAVVDGARGFGNGHLLPAGPLRESPSRLKSVDQILEQYTGNDDGGSVLRRRDDRKSLRFRLVPHLMHRLDGSESCAIEAFSGREVHAVAGIGNPWKFFDLLENYGLKVYEHPKRDHAQFSALDLTFADKLPVVITEKDAVKCRNIGLKNCWYVSVDVEFEESRGDAWIDFLVQRLTAINAGDV
jgi:tetraacyldisaccharide 4'-kinase